MIATARLSFRMYARSRGVSSVFAGTGIAPILIAPKNVYAKGGEVVAKNHDALFDPDPQLA